MDVWKLIAPGVGDGVCDAVSVSHPVLLSGRGIEAVLLDANPLAGTGMALPSGLNVPAVAVRSGRFEATGNDEADAVDAARRTWSEAGRSAFEAARAALGDQAARLGVDLWVHPRAGDVLGDVPGLRSLAAGRVGVLLEPAGLLTGSMIDDAWDHFERMVDEVELSGVVRAVVVTNLSGAGGDRVPIGEGLIDPGAMRDLALKVSGWAPVCVLEPDAESLARSLA